MTPPEACRSVDPAGEAFSCRRDIGAIRYEHGKTRRLAPPGSGFPRQNGISSSLSIYSPSSFSACFARLRKLIVSAMISQP